jgi:hypothetical protein
MAPGAATFIKMAVVLSLYGTWSCNFYQNGCSFKLVSCMAPGAATFIKMAAVLSLDGTWSCNFY